MADAIVEKNLEVKTSLIRDQIKIKSALVSVYSKDKLDLVIYALYKLGITIYSTGGTQKFIKNHGVPVTAVEDLTQFPEMLDGRVKTLHPRIFGGLLAVRNDAGHMKVLADHQIPEIDLVIVDLYPFEEVVNAKVSEEKIIENGIDIGGNSIIRAAAKNFYDVLTISSRDQYEWLAEILEKQNGVSTLAQRRKAMVQAYNISSHFDSQIFNYFNNTLPEEDRVMVFKKSVLNGREMRYGENPQQNGFYYGNLEDVFEVVQEGKELSYNNLKDIHAAVMLVQEFTQPTAAIIKHQNSCGLATRSNIMEAYKAAHACDPISAFGSIINLNKEVDVEVATLIHMVFTEVVIAPSYTHEAIKILSAQKTLRILIQKRPLKSENEFSSCLEGLVEQTPDTLLYKDFVIKAGPLETLSPDRHENIIFGIKASKHLKSNCVVLIKNKTLAGFGAGRTNRIDALKDALRLVNTYGIGVDEDTILVSEAFFPEADCVNEAHKYGIKIIVEPGGSVKDHLSIEAAQKNGQTLIFTGVRHFKH